MKYKYTYLIVSCVILLSAFNSGSFYAQENQMPAKDRIQQSKDQLPATTSSPEARQNYIQALNYLENSQVDKARPLFQSAIKADPKFALAYMGAALTAPTFSESKEYFDKAENLVGQASEGEKHLVGMAKAQFEGNTEKGKTEAQQLDNLYPDNKQIQFMIGQFYFFLDNERDQAISHLQKAVSIDEKYAPAYNLLGYAYSDKNDFANAENAFKKYISLMPDNPNPYDSYAELLLKNGRYDESIQQYEKALSIDPQFYSSLEGIGNNYLFQGNYEKARENYKSIYNKAESANWKLASLYDQAAAFVRERKFDDAVKVLDERASLAQTEGAIPALINSYSWMGLIYDASGKPDEAKRQFDMASNKLNNAAVPEEMKKNLTGQLDLNKSYAMAGEVKSGTQSAQNQGISQETGSMGTSANDKNSEKLQGLSALRQNKYDEAISHFTKVEKQSPLDWYYLSVAYSKKGDTQKANEMIEKIKKSNQNSMELAVAYARTNDVTSGK